MSPTLAALWAAYREYLAYEAQSANDPEDEPYRSLYSAREKLQEMLEHLRDDTLVGVPAVSAVQSYVLLLLAKNHVNTDERAMGEQTSRSALEAIEIVPETDPPVSEHVALTADYVYVYLATLNYLGFIFETRSDHEKALKYLQDAEFVYCAYKVQMEEHTAPIPPWWTLARLCQVEDEPDSDYSYNEAIKQFELVHTLTIYYLAQVYKNVGEREKSANYCEKTLVRQLESGDYEPIEWALNAATLSQYYVDKVTTDTSALLQRAHHCLAASEAVINEYNHKMIDQGNEESDDEKERREQAMADIYRCWSKYGLLLLDLSHQKLMQPEEGDSLKPPADDELRLEDLELEEKKAPEEDTTLDMCLADVTPLFPQLNLIHYETQISNKLVTEFNPARQVFLKVQHWLHEAHQFYTIDNHCTDYIEVAQDQSRLFRLLANFEHDLARRCKMHKKRIDLMNDILQQVSVEHYQRLCQQMLFECGEVCNEMLNLKLDAIEETQTNPTAHQAAKVNLLAAQGISYFTRFLDTFKDPEGQDPEKYGEEAIRAVVLARFYIARLWNKVITESMQEKLAHCAKSLNEYEWIVKYCEEIDPESRQFVREELDACKEMASLLPVKISRLKDAAM